MNKANLFKPSLFSSQPCEHMFRTFRSMGTINYTKINFSLNELLHLIARLEIMNTIVYSNKKIEFARISALNSPETEHLVQLPSDGEIAREMEAARKNALLKAREFGIYLSENDITQNIEF